MPVSPVLSGIHLLKGCLSLFRTTLVPHYSLGQWFGACTSSTNITCELVRNTNSWVYWPTIIEPLGMRPGKLSKWILCILKFKNHCFRRNSSNSKAVRQCAFNQMWFPSSARILGVLHATVLTFVTTLCLQLITSSLGQGAYSTLPLLYLSHFSLFKILL